MNNLEICQVCKKNPAVYGDDETWSRCSACQLDHLKKKGKTSKSPTKEKGFKHEINPDLTSIIIPIYMVNYTLFHYTGNCIGQVREHTPEQVYELIIVDNGSPIQPPDLSSYYAHKVVKNEKNLGVVKAWNQGIRVSKGGYIVLLNNDVPVYEGWLGDMKKELETYDLVMAHPMYSLTEPFARAVEANQAKKGKKKFDDIPGGRDFSCVMFKRSLLDEIGAFDERFFSYSADSDFLKRMDNAGKKYSIVNVFTSHISDATGYAMSETPDIMNKDKEEFDKKWENIKEEEKNFTPLDTEVPKLIRTKETGNMIFYFVKDEWHHIKDPETLEALGFKFGDETLLDKFPEKVQAGEEISMENYKNYV